MLFDNELAKKAKEILFVKIENDGFDLGAQRRPTQKNDLPLALEHLKQLEAEGRKAVNKMPKRCKIVEKTRKLPNTRERL